MANQSLGRLTVDMVANTGSLETDVNKATKSVKGFTKQSEEQRESLERLVGQLDPTVAAYAKLDKMEEQLRKHRKAGAIDIQEYERFSKSIENQRKEVAKSTVAQGKNAKTAKELAFSMRGLPAQFTDIAVSLQGGQRPMTVLLQQGGQLKDMFGGLGPAIRYMTSYVVGLINPVTVLAAAVGTLAFGFFKGRSETDAFNKVLAQTGNQAGTTAGQLQAMAADIDGVVGTQAAAAEALVAIVSEGKFVESQFERIAISALKFEKATGQAIEETTEAFAKIAEDPVEGLIEVNQQYNFLTAATYRQVSALREQGLEIEANEMLFNSFADTMDKRSDEISENLGTLQRFWRGIVTVTKEAGDAILSVGRARTVETILDDANLLLSIFEKITDENSGTVVGLREWKKELEEQLALEIAIADAQENWLFIMQNGLKAEKQLNEALKGAQTEAEKLEERYAQIAEQVETAALAGIEYSNQQIETLRRLAREQILKDEGGTSNAGEILLRNLREQNAVLNSQVMTTETLSKAQQDLIKWNNRIADIKSKDVLTAEEESLLLNEQAITLQYRKNVELEGELTNRELINKTVSDYNKLMKGLQTDEEAMVSLTSERLGLLRKMWDLGQLGAGEFQSAMGAIVSGSVQDSPDISGVVGRDSGQSAQMGRISQSQARLDDWYSSQIETLNRNREEQLGLNEKWNELEADLYEEYMIKTGELTLSMQQEKLKNANSNFDKFAQSAARNMQTAFADFLFDPFKDGLEGMVKGFADALRRMMAEAMAAKALEAGLNFLMNSTNPVASSIGSIFGGSKDSGGQGEAGKSYLIGAGAQPEMFVPDSAGTFIPNADELGGEGSKVSYQFNVDATDAGAEERIKSMIERDVFPRIVEVASGKTIAQLRRPRFA